MRKSSSRFGRRSARILSIVIASTLLTACATSTPSSSGLSPLAKAQCPEPTPLTDGSFGATTEKLAWYAVTYRKCLAAIGVLKPRD